MATKFPYDDVEKLLEPIVRLVTALANKRKLPKWPGGFQLGVPVHHCVLQPQQLLDRLRGDDHPEDDALDMVILLAFQFGVCQGYAIRAEERRELEEVQKLLVDIATRNGKKDRE